MNIKFVFNIKYIKGLKKYSIIVLNETFKLKYSLELKFFKTLWRFI